jgi:hypothetical protein
VARELDRLVVERSRPKIVVSDNCSELTSNPILAWADQSRVAWHYIAPGKPMQNAFIESFCEIAWDKAPHFWVICIQSGPQAEWFTLASWTLGGRDWNAGCGNDRQDTPGVFRQKKPIKEICRDLRVSRKAVRKIVRSDATEFHYERSTQPFPKIGPWRDRLDCLLRENEEKPTRERLTFVRIFEKLRGFGYEGSYDAVRRYAIKWRKALRGISTGLCAARFCAW